MESVWRQTCDIAPRPALERDLVTCVAVIGGGMAGILIADALRQAGKPAVVLEADCIAGGQTQNTTAKITAQHGLIYARLLHALGPEKAGQYAAANQQAVASFRELVSKREIDCEFAEKDSYLYGDDLFSLTAEAEAARQAGLPAALTGALPLLFPCPGAVRLPRQAQFHPLKFLRAVAEGLTVYERTPVRVVEGNILKAGRHTVRADHIVFACHYPFVNFPGLYFARMHQERSYVLALKNTPAVDGMFYGIDGGPSLRMYGDLLLIGGEGHRTGDNRGGGRYDALRRKADDWFPAGREEARWSAQDCITADGVPYIGRFASDRPNWYAATGFGKWGMTSSMVAAWVIRELICGRPHPYPVFDPVRFSPAALSGVLGECGHAVKDLGKLLLKIPADTADRLPPGHGGVVFLNGKKVGVYRSDNGTLHVVDVRCPHLGCQLEWNPDEKSWDCPCHGSRFDCTGRLLSGPAQRDITK